MAKLLWSAPVLLAFLAGCGGSGGSSVPATPAEVSAEKGTALFDVDVASGKVKVVPLETGKGKSAVLGGSAVTFETTTLLSEGGEVGRRSVKVKLKNNLSEAIGVGRPIRIQFGVIGPAAGYQTDLRSLCTVGAAVKSVGIGSVDGPVGTAQISVPSAVAAGQDGSIYFNGTDNRIRRLSDGYVSTVATNVPASGLTYLRDPATGREYLVAPCASLHSIKLVPIASGSVTTWAGLDNTSGNANGAASTARFNGPSGAAVDAGLAQVLVADTGNGSVRGIPFTFSGGNLVAGTVLNRYSGLTNPRAVCVSSNRSVGVVETSASRVRIFNAGSSKEVIIGTLGNSNGDGNTAGFNNPQGITAIGDTFFLTDNGNLQVKRIALKNGAAPLLPVNWTVGVIAGTGTLGSLDGTGDVATFDGILQMATDGQGRILVAEAGTNGIRRLTTEGSFDFGTPNGDGIGQAQLANPTGFADLSTLQRPYIEVAQRVEPGATVDAGEWQFSIPPGINSFRFSVTVETGTSVYAGLEAVSNLGGSGPGSPNVVGQYLSRASSVAGSVGDVGNVTFDNSASFVAKDAAGNLFVSDYSLGTIRRVGPTGKVTLIAGRQYSYGTTDGDGGTARFTSPAGLKVNREGTELLVIDSSAQIVRLIRLSNAAADPEVASNWTVSTIAGLTGTAGDTDGFGGAARFRGPFGAAGPDTNSVYISEVTGHRIRLLKYIGGNRGDAASWSVSLIAGSPTAVSGFADASGSNARFNSPYGLAYSRAGLLYVTDTVNRRIRSINLLGGIVTTIAGNGSGGGNDSDTALSASFNGPYGVATDDSGVVYISEYGYVRRVFNGTVRTVAGGGDGSDTTGDKLNPNVMYGLEIDPRGDLIGVCNGRLLRLTRKLGR